MHHPTDIITHNTALIYSSRGTLAGTRNSPKDLPRRIDPTTHRNMSERSYHGAKSCSLVECGRHNLVNKIDIGDALE